jgi:hypothetical protein
MQGIIDERNNTKIFLTEASHDKKRYQKEGRG